jgi:hypothetical protein
LKKSFQFKTVEEVGGLTSAAGVEGVGSGWEVVDTFRVPVLQRLGVKKEPGGLAGGGVAERRESLDEARGCDGL